MPLAYAALFLASFVAQVAFQVYRVGDSWDDFGAAVFENWQSEFLQLLFQMLFLKWLIHKGNPQSKDSQEAMDRKLDKILENQASKVRTLPM